MLKGCAREMQVKHICTLCVTGLLLRFTFPGLTHMRNGKRIRMFSFMNLRTFPRVLFEGTPSASSLWDHSLGEARSTPPVVFAHSLGSFGRLCFGMVLGAIICRICVDSRFIVRYICLDSNDPCRHSFGVWIGGSVSFAFFLYLFADTVSKC